LVGFDGPDECNSNEANQYINHLLKTGERTESIAINGAGSRMTGTDDVNLDPAEINGLQQGLQDTGLDSRSMSTGIVVLHETMHTKYGASFFNRREDKIFKAPYNGRFQDGKLFSPIVSQINRFRKSMGLPTRDVGYLVINVP
jgi:hypothetical protein